MFRASRRFLPGLFASGVLPALAIAGSTMPVSAAAAEPVAPVVVVNGSLGGHVANLFTRVLHATGNRISAVTNSNFAGYIFFNSPTSLTATLKVPHLSCPASGFYETSAGAELQGPVSSSISFENAYVYMFCENGAASYSGSFVTGSASNPTMTPWTFTPAAGDKVKLRIVTAANFSDMVKDVTQTKSSSVSGPCSSCGGSEGGVSMSIGPAPPFGTVNWTHATVDGGTLAASDPDRYQDVNGSDVLITTSKITGGGSSFTNTFVASS
jgi:hypothetical protein